MHGPVNVKPNVINMTLKVKGAIQLHLQTTMHIEIRPTV